MATRRELRADTKEFTGRVPSLNCAMDRFWHGSSSRADGCSLSDYILSIVVQTHFQTNRASGALEGPCDRSGSRLYEGPAAACAHAERMACLKMLATCYSHQHRYDALPLEI
eukprot:6184208-Pleurochrysis_carterae.AAC.3